MFIVGHRGAKMEAPENTLKAIRIGMRCAEFIEVDVRLTLDRIPVIMHDPGVDRTTDGEGLVRDMTYEELHNLNAGDGERVPSLSEVCRLVNGECGLFIEVKEPGTEMEICAVLDHESISPAWVVSFHSSVLETVSELLPGTPTGLIFPRPIPGVVEIARRKKIHGILPRFDIAEPELVASAHSSDITVVPWTLNDTGEWERAAGSGVDGFATDRPCSAKKWKEEHWSNVPG